MFSDEDALGTFCQSVAQSENPYETLIFDNCLFSPPSSSSLGRRGGPSRELTRAIRGMCDDCPSLRALSFQVIFFFLVIYLLIFVFFPP